MPETVTIDEMVRRLRNLQVIVARNADKFPREVLTQIRRFIIRTHTIDTADLLVTYDFHEIVQTGNASEFQLEPNQRYGRKEGFTEFARPAYGLRGRGYIKSGIEASNFQAISDEIIYEVFG